MVRSFLAFFNVLEDQEKMVISISKTGMWSSIILTAYIVLFKGDASTSEMIAALTNQFVMTSNYAWKKHMALKGETLKKDSG